MAAAPSESPSASRQDSRPLHSTHRVLKLTAAAIAILAMITLAAVWLVSREMNAARVSHFEVQRTREVLEQLQFVLSTLQDAETSERGFVITGNESFLDPYLETRTSLEPQLERLQTLIVDPRIGEAREELARLVREQLAFLQQVVELRDTDGFDSSAAVVAGGEGKRRMDAIRERIDQIRTYEEAELASRLNVFNERSERSQSIVTIVLLASVVIICVAGWLLLRHISHRIRAERAAGDAFALLRAAMDNLAQGVAVFDSQRRLIVWNKRYLQLRDLRDDDVRVHMPIEELAAVAAPLTMRRPEGEIDSRTAHSGRVDTGSAIDGEAVKGDGSVLRIHGRPIPNGNFIVTYADVTDLKQSELAYRDQATRLAAILDNVVDAIITINESGSIESWSNGAERVFGYKSEEVLRRNVRMLMPDPHASAHDGYIRRYLDTGERRIIGTRREVEALHKDGRRVPVDLGISEMKIGQRRMFIGIVRDISERLEIERLKSGFVSTVSHELRTPLTSIAGSLGLLAGGVAGELPPKAQRLVDIAKLNSDRLVRLINDILDLEKAELGRLEFRFELQQLMPIVEQAIDLNRAYAQGFGATIELDPSSDDARVLVDRDRLAQVLTNLLSNAAKFSPQGGVITVLLRQQGEDIAISVHDQGPGIPEQFHNRIFQKFAQADSSDSRAKGGTGLGLSIVKAISERLGGSVTFESKAGAGTTFRVMLPIPRPRPQLPEYTPSAAPSAGGPTVLVCEDDPDVAALLAEILRKEGMRAETVTSVRAARAALEAVRFDIAIIDLHLPDGEGLDFISELRANEKTKSLPVIVVTAKSRGTADVALTTTLELADWLQKPIDPQRLLDSIRAVLSQPCSHRACILHVEDDVSLTRLVKELLDNDADVVAAHSLADAKAAVNGTHFDLVILDIALGDGSGLDILPLLGNGVQRPPVILYSATEAGQEISSKVEAALVKSRNSVDELLASVRALAQRGD